MATYTGKKGLLDAALGEFKDIGFELQEPDDHIALLYFKDKIINTYYQSTLTIPLLRGECLKFLKELER